MTTCTRTFLTVVVCSLTSVTILAQSGQVPADALTGRAIKAVGYQVGGGDTTVDLKATALGAGACGEAKVEAKTAVTMVEAKVQGLRPSTQLGTEFLSYVIWAVSPEGRAVSKAQGGLELAENALARKANRRGIISLAKQRPPTREALARVSGIIVSHPGLKLEVEGHTDSTGSDELNQTLSRQRAESVRGYLVQQGLASEAVTAMGFGKTMPVADNGTAAGRQKNGRVELVVSGEVIGVEIGN